jgi:predicted outer membrane repeat protein
LLSGKSAFRAAKPAICFSLRKLTFRKAFKYIQSNLRRFDSYSRPIPEEFWLMKIACSSFKTSLFSFILAMTLPLSAQAATITVTSGADAGGTCPGANCTLRQAIAVSAAGGTIDFAAGLTNVILTTAQLTIDKNLTIQGPGANLLSIQRSSAGVPNFRVFSITSAQVTMSDLTISRGYPPVLSSGGGIYNSGILTIANVIISTNVGTLGGGIYNSSSGTTTITRCTISGNVSIGSGGGIYNENLISIFNSTISGNSTDLNGNGGGGGIYSNGSLLLAKSTISGNSAAGLGGGIYVTNTLSLSSVTITGNSANEGGGVYELSGQVTSENTLTASNTAVMGPNFRLKVNHYQSFGYNLIGNNQDVEGIPQATGDQVGTQNSQIDPKLGPLKDNGGPTWTHALLSGSPAIEGGKTAIFSLDQRGFARPVDSPAIPNATGGDGSDIGAYEVQADILPGCNTIPRVVTNNNDSSAGSLRQVIGSVCAGSTITFAPNVTGQINLTSGELVVGKSMTINGPGASVLSVRRDNAAGTFRIFNVTPAGVVANLSGLTIANGIGVPSGGGIHNSGTLNLARVAVSGNLATNGGGIYNNSGTLNITDSTVSGNTLGLIIDGSGGGIFNFGGTLNVINSTISGNTAHSNGNGDSGGGILTNVGTVSLSNSTITGNTGDLGGGIRNINGGTVRSNNTIIALNTSASGPDVNGPLTSENFNLIGNSFGATITPAQFSDQIGTSGAPINPLIGALLDNGGPTRTHALLAGSTAIDKGRSFGLIADQRGLIRPYNWPDISNDPNGDGSDIGAFELQPKPELLFKNGFE